MTVEDLAKRIVIAHERAGNPITSKQALKYAQAQLAPPSRVYVYDSPKRAEDKLTFLSSGTAPQRHGEREAQPVRNDAKEFALAAYGAMLAAGTLASSISDSCSFDSGSGGDFRRCRRNGSLLRRAP